MKTFIKSMLLSFSLLAFLSISAQAQGNFVYTNDDPFASLNTVTGFAVGANGVLTELPGSPFLTGGLGGGGGLFATNRAEICFNGNVLYVVNLFSCDISAFTINPTTGNLTPVPGSPFAMIGGGIPLNVSLACSTDGRFLYMSDDDADSIAAFAIAANGALTPTANIVFTGGLDPASLKASPDGRFLTTALRGAGVGISVYTIAANGALALVPGSPFPAGVGRGIDINCGSNLLYAGEAVLGPNLVRAFTIGGNGVLTPVAGSPFTGGTGQNSNNVVVTPNDRFLYVSNNNSASVTGFTINANGSLTLIPGSPFPIATIGQPAGIATNAAGTLLYVANTDDTVAVFQIGANGVLTAAPGSPFATGEEGFSLISLSAFPSKSCFDLCIQDNSGTSFLKINTTTGAYEFRDCSKGTVLTGTGTVLRAVNNDFCKLELRDSGPDPKRGDRIVTASVNTCTGTGSATIRIFGGGLIGGINDSNIFDNTCACP